MSITEIERSYRTMSATFSNSNYIIRLSECFKPVRGGQKCEFYKIIEHKLEDLYKSKVLHHFKLMPEHVFTWNRTEPKDFMQLRLCCYTNDTKMLF